MRLPVALIPKLHHRIPRMAFVPLAKNGLGISSLSGSHTGTGGRSRSIWSVASFTPCDGFPTSVLRGLPPALACANSTRVLPWPALRFLCMTAFTISSPPSFPCLDSSPFVALDNPCICLLVGLPASVASVADEGIFESLRLGLLLSPAGRISGSVTVRGKAEAVAARATAALFDVDGKGDC